MQQQKTMANAETCICESNETNLYYNMWIYIYRSDLEPTAGTAAREETLKGKQDENKNIQNS